MDEYREYLRLAQEITEGIEKAIEDKMEDKNIGRVVFRGAFGSPTLDIDSLAEEKALEVISSSNLKLNVLTEERGFIDTGSEETLILDPIDGTANFISGIPFYAVSVAFACGDNLSDVFFGYVKNVPTDEVFFSSRGGGARFFVHGNEIKPLSRGLDMENIRASIYLGKGTEVPKFIKKIRYVRLFGAASLDMCLVAKGSLDMYYFVSAPQHRLRIVDIAASALVLRESGGYLLNENLENLEMKIDTNDRRNLIAMRNRGILDLVR